MDTTPEDQDEEQDQNQDKDDDGGPDSAARAAGPAPTLQQVVDLAEELWPSGLAEPWDAVGLVAGRRERPVRTVHFAVDPVRAVVEEACDAGADLLITHHPLLLRGVHSVDAAGYKGEIVHRLIESSCGLLTAHTNGDSAVGGVNDVLAGMLGLQQTAPLKPAEGGVAPEGLGRLGTLEVGTTLGELAGRLFGLLPAVAGGVRAAGDRDGIVQRVALCGGAGDSLLDVAREAEADVFITADLRHHPASEAREAVRDGRPYLIDVSHFASEWLWLPTAAQALQRALADRGYDVEVVVSGITTDPWDFVLTPGG